jgi:hypothetical protein
MKLCPDIDLERSLRLVFANQPGSAEQVAADCARQTKTVEAILERFFSRDDEQRREISILADEVGLGKTYVALAVAVSILDAIRKGDQPADLPSYQPIVLVLTPNNPALFNKWMREAMSFRKDCARSEGALDWLQIVQPRDGSKAGNVLDMTARFRDAQRRNPMLMIAKQNALGAGLNQKDYWRKRALAVIFKEFKVGTDDRKSWCRAAVSTGAVSKVPELIDMRKSGSLWKEDEDISPNVHRAFMRALEDRELSEKIDKALKEENKARFVTLVDDLIRNALSGDWPQLPLVIIDEIHGLKTESGVARRNMKDLLSGKVCRLLGLSATPFQLRPDELLSVLKLRGLLDAPPPRLKQLDDATLRLDSTIKRSKAAGETFRERWVALRDADGRAVNDAWSETRDKSLTARREAFDRLRPPRIAHALQSALDLGATNRALTENLRPFVIRHLHPRGYREHFVGSRISGGSEKGAAHFSWAPGLEVKGDEELVHYLMMRAVALAKEEKGLPPLGAELTGSYRHLTETAAIWKRLENAKNPSLKDYKSLLDGQIRRRPANDDPDSKHRKVQTTVDRALECFKRGQKALVFCVYTKTAEAVRDRINSEVERYLAERAETLFKDANALENFRRRFFNPRETLFSLIQDQPLLGILGAGPRVGIPAEIALDADALEEVARFLTESGEFANVEKPNRRLLLAAVEHVAVQRWTNIPAGREWLKTVLGACPDLEAIIRNKAWLQAREPLSRSTRASRRFQDADPEAGPESIDPLDAEAHEEESAKASLSPEVSVRRWVERLRNESIGETIAPYFRTSLISRRSKLAPLLARFHTPILAKLNLESRIVAGQVFRRILMAPEFLLRYLASVDRNDAERWPQFLSSQYEIPLAGHLETLRDRVDAYFETLERGQGNAALRGGYIKAATNQNVVQLVKGGVEGRDRYFLGFNTPYRPEILISTQVGAEGIDLHRECRHVIHHDLCWNPATIEQRTGRVDRIGSKVERERLNAKPADAPTLEIGVPYLAATYDERMFEELYRRAQLFEVTMGGEMRVDGRIAEDEIEREKLNRAKDGVGTEDEDIGKEEGLSEILAIPDDMVQSLRVDLAVWRPVNRGSK